LDFELFVDLGNFFEFEFAVGLYEFLELSVLFLAERLKLLQHSPEHLNRLGIHLARLFELQLHFGLKLEVRLLVLLDFVVHGRLLALTLRFSKHLQHLLNRRNFDLQLRVLVQFAQQTFEFHCVLLLF